MKNIATLTSQTLAVITAFGITSAPYRSQAQTAGLDQSFPADLVPISLADAPPSNVRALYLMSTWPTVPPLPPPVVYGRPQARGALPLPIAWSGVPTNGAVYFSHSSGAVFVDDRQAAAERMLGQAAMDTPIFPDEGAGGSGSPWPYATNQFWVEPVCVVSNLFNAVLHGTTNGSTYLITSTESLNPMSNSIWLVEGSLQGGPDGATPFALGVALRTNSLFIRAQACDECASTALSLSWQLACFGVTGVPAEGDYDGDGVTNLDEYKAGTDPNKISFSLSVANQYVNSTSVPLQVSVSGGVPSGMAVLVDSTDFDGATWTSFNPNPTVDLGTGQGWHYVWMGLRGASTASQPTWQRVRLMLDYTPPALVITNPVVLAGSQPLIQVQGYCIKPLASLSCDLNNSAGLATNQMALVLDQYYDTNTWAFTTNYFQVFDLFLTNGLNTITLYATDLAGNSSTASFTYVITNDTVPPVITLGWPQDGQKLCGESYTVDGWLDDSSASVQVSLVDSSGGTNTFDGLVERDGRFWVENLPLADGSNPLALTATDAWGNSATTNITVHKSDLALAVAPIDPNELFQPTISIDGTVSDLTCTIWVNGVPAVNNGDGTWHADSVPVNPSRTTSFAVSAYPAGHDLEASAASVEKPNVDPPDRLYVASDIQYANSQDEWYCEEYDLLTEELVGWSDDDFQSQYGHFWADGAGGGGGGFSQYVIESSEGGRSGQCGLSLNWPHASWPNFVPGTEIDVGERYNSDLWAFLNARGTAASPIIGQEHCDVSDPQNSSYSYITADGLYSISGWDHRTYNRSAQTTMKLFTGGKAIPGRHSLFVISASARELLNKRAVPPYAGVAEGGGISFPYPCNLLPNHSVIIGDLAALGSDGLLYKVLPTGVTKDVTPVVPSKEFYWFNVTEQRHRLFVQVNNYLLVDGQVRPQAHYCVGQGLTFTSAFVPAPPNVSQKEVQWMPCPGFVNKQNPPTYQDGSPDYVVDFGLLAQEPALVWWTSGGFVPKLSWMNVRVNLTFANGQEASVPARGQFTMHRPRLLDFRKNLEGPVAVNLVHQHPVGTSRNRYSGLDALDVSPGGAYEVYVQAIAPFSGQAGSTQTLNGRIGTDWSMIDTHGYPCLDNEEFYSGTRGLGENNGYKRRLRLRDHPYGPLSGQATWGTLWLDFEDYIRFKPDAGPGPNIYVTLGSVDWHAHGNTTLGTVGGTDIVDFSPVTTQNDWPTYIPIGDADMDDLVNDVDYFPYWVHKVVNP